MSICVIPAMELPDPLSVPDSPFHRLTTLPRSRLVETRDVLAADRRQLTKHFTATFEWAAIRPLLPLRLDTPPDVRPWRRRLCRSHYAWRPPDDIRSIDDWEGLDDFDLVLRLFDFSPWRPILGQRFSSNIGPPPFDPVSIGLAWLLVRWRNWTWSDLLTELHSRERGLGYCQCLGFSPDDLPAESTFRMALTNTEGAWLRQCADSLMLGLMAYGLVPTQATFPGDPPEKGAPIVAHGVRITSTTSPRASTSWTIGCSPTGQSPAPSSPPTATTTCKPSPVSKTCSTASPTSPSER